jgi:hypothetical protein
VELQGFNIDFCTAAAGTSGVGMLEYAALDAVELDSYEPTTDATYLHRRTLSATWHTLPFVVGTGAYTEAAAPNPQGTTYRVAVSVFLPGDSPAVRAELNSMRHRRYMLRMKNRDGQLLLIGTPEQPLRFESRFTSGPQGGDQRGYECRFEGNTLTKSPGYAPLW